VVSPWGMELRRHQDIAVFAELAAPLLHADPLRHTGMLTVLDGSARADPVWRVATMITLHEGGLVRGAVLRTEARPLLASALPPAAAGAVAEVLAEHDPGIPGVVGPREPVEAFAAAWTPRVGVRAREDMAMRLFVLDGLLPPTGVPGAARLAGTADVDLLALWRQDFVVEALPANWVMGDSRDAVLRWLAVGAAFVLWEVDGEPVASAAASAPVAGMSRINQVWTPPVHRGHGYGSAVTAAASRWALDSGADRVVLFTDLANPVSNAIYPRIGYRPVGDFAEWGFERP
jgi:predicted GNAT family acetyltransferase